MSVISVSNNWQFITSDEVRQASLEQNVLKAEMRIKAINDCVATILAHLASMALFGYFYTPYWAANYAVGATIASPLVKTPIVYVTDAVSANSIRAHAYHSAATEGVNEEYCPSVMDMARKKREFDSKEVKSYKSEPPLFERAKGLIMCA